MGSNFDIGAIRAAWTGVAGPDGQSGPIQGRRTFMMIELTGLKRVAAAAVVTAAMAFGIAAPATADDAAVEHRKTLPPYVAGP